MKREESRKGWKKSSEGVSLLEKKTYVFHYFIILITTNCVVNNVNSVFRHIHHNKNLLQAYIFIQPNLSFNSKQFQFTRQPMNSCKKNVFYSSGGAFYGLKR